MKPLIFISILGVMSMIQGCDTTETNTDVPRDVYGHIRPAWSPDGVSVAFTGEVNGIFGIYAVDTSGANLRRIHTGDAVGLSWSPDGSSIAYSELSRIYTVPVGIDNPQLIVSVLPSIRPSWSPDGTTLAYVRNGIRVVTLATGQDREIQTSGTSPSWTADGTNIIISDSRADELSGGIRFDIYRMSVDSLKRTDIHSFVAYDNCAFFTVSPDGQYLLFGRKPDGAYASVSRITLVSQTEVALTADGGDYPAISPDGEWIAYTRTTEGEGGVWIMRMDGSEKRRLTTP